MLDPEADQHDFSDDSDYAAATLASPQASRSGGGGGSIQRWDSAKIAASDPGSGLEVVYSKDNVAVHPTQTYCERINGRLRLIKHASALFLSWIPYKTRTDGADSLGNNSHSGLIVKGLAFPPFYFYRGGAREFLTTLKHHAFITRSPDDANVFLLNDFQDPLQKTLSSLDLPGIVSVGKKSSLHDPVGEDALLHKSERVNEVTHDGTSSISEYSEQPNHKSDDHAHDISIQVLQKFSLLTKFARNTTLHLFGESLSDGLNAHEEKHQNVDVPVDSISTPDDQTSDEILVPADPLEEILPLIGGTERKHPLSVHEWDAFLDSEGRITDSKALRKRIFYGGVEHDLRKEVWKFLLGYHEYDSTHDERKILAAIKKEEYEVLKSQWQSISASQAKKFTKFRERKGLIDKDVVRTDRSVSYYEGDDNPNIRPLRDILLTYSFYNFDLGYCQGMSDLLSPILHVMEDESESFWCFAALMERLGPNFNRDQSGMHAQLLALPKLVELLDSPLHNYFKQADCLNYFFCFRWILIQFKREFEYNQVMYLWEVIWTYYLSEHFHLYICVAILKRYRKKIIGEQMDFDTLLKFINELSGNIDLDPIIKDAEALCVCAGENGPSSIPPGTPPSLPVETDTGLYTEEDDVL